MDDDGVLFYIIILYFPFYCVFASNLNHSLSIEDPVTDWPVGTNEVVSFFVN